MGLEDPIRDWLLRLLLDVVQHAQEQATQGRTWKATVRDLTNKPSSGCISFGGRIRDSRCPKTTTELGLQKPLFTTFDRSIDYFGRRLTKADKSA